jgi:hypothetical protein
VDGKQLQQQYKEHISDYHSWGQKGHAKQWMLFEGNLSPYLSIDETALSNGELYTIVTNKEAKGRKGTLVAMIKGVQAEKIIEVLHKIPEYLRKRVREVTIDMAASLNLAVRRCFPRAHKVTMAASTCKSWPSMRCRKSVSSSGGRPWTRKAKK